LYYTFFSAMFASLLGAAASIRKRTFKPVILALSLAGSMSIVMVIAGYGTGITEVLSGRLRQVDRFPWEELYFGLNPSEALQVYSVLPGMHGVLTDYMRVFRVLYGANGLFEWPGVLLTTVIIAAPFIALLGDRRSLLPFLAASCITFGII